MSDADFEHTLVKIPRGASGVIPETVCSTVDEDDFLTRFIRFGPKGATFVEVPPYDDERVRATLLPRLQGVLQAQPDGSVLFNTNGGAPNDKVTAEDIAEMFDRGEHSANYLDNRIFVARIPENSQVLYVHSYIDVENRNCNSTFIVLKAQDAWSWYRPPSVQTPPCKECAKREKPFECRACEERFVSRNTLFRHLKENPGHAK